MRHEDIDLPRTLGPVVRKPDAPNDEVIRIRVDPQSTAKRDGYEFVNTRNVPQDFIRIDGIWRRRD